MNNESLEIATIAYTFEEKVGHFTSVYEPSGYPNVEGKPSVCMGSLNAGDEQLYIGGAAINKAFNIAIREKDNDATLHDLSIEMHLSCYLDCYDIKEEEDVLPDKYSRTKYLTMVNNKYALSKKAGTLHHYDAFKQGGKFENNPYFTDMFLYISETRLCDFLSNSLYPGDIFIDILKNPPCNNGANKAMLYCVGPKGMSSAENFKDAVYIVGKNIANAIYHYNNYNNRIDTERIDYVRICLISGGNFKHDDVSRIEVAECLIKGIRDGNIQTHSKNVVYNFAFDNNAFKIAYDTLNE
uniref:Uncharacterized protein n=1 Tax=viral metagenome TaxID=1070528 RepID=A0A6C0LDM7_9ZZZZ